MDSYKLNNIMNKVNIFINNLNNWYIRKSRSRFWNSDLKAIQTLYEVLLTVSRVIAPFIPFMAEYMYQILSSSDNFSSVHLSTFPIPILPKDLELSYKMNIAMIICKIGRKIRRSNKIKVRQPLRSCTISTSNVKVISAIEASKDIIADELNVKEVNIVSEEQDIYNLAFKPNFKTLGPRFGKNMGTVASFIKNITKEKWELLNNIGYLVVANDTITPNDIIVTKIPHDGIAIHEYSGILVALDTTLDDDLREEGLIREIVSRLQKMRKDNKLNISDRIVVEFRGSISHDMERALNNNIEYIKTEALVTSLCFFKEVKQPKYLNMFTSTILDNNVINIYMNIDNNYK